MLFGSRLRSYVLARGLAELEICRQPFAHCQLVGQHRSCNWYAQLARVCLLPMCMQMPSCQQVSHGQLTYDGIIFSWCLVVGAVLLNPTSHATRQRVEQDANYLSVHIAAGSYWSDAACTTFAEIHPDAAHTWRLLQPRFGVLGAVANETTAANTTTATTGGATGGTWMKREFDDRPSKKELSAALKRHRSIEGIHF